MTLLESQGRRHRPGVLRPADARHRRRRVRPPSGAHRLPGRPGAGQRRGRAHPADGRASWRRRTASGCSARCPSRSRPSSCSRCWQRNESRRVGLPRRAHALRTPTSSARALAGGELVNHYQPKVDLSTGAAGRRRDAGALAASAGRPGLSRPVHLDSPRSNGLIDALTAVVLDMALRRRARWHDGGLDLHVAVNVSMDNLAALDFPDSRRPPGRRAPASPSSGLVLEVTESRLMRDLRASLDIVTRLRLKRIGLSIDDFGTGHSSLAQLRDIPFDELKLDRSFVTRRGTRPGPARHRRGHPRHGAPARHAVGRRRRRNAPTGTFCARSAATSRRAISSPGPCRVRIGCLAIAVAAALSRSDASQNMKAAPRLAEWVGADMLGTDAPSAAAAALAWLRRTGLPSRADRR